MNELTTTQTMEVTATAAAPTHKRVILSGVGGIENLQLIRETIPEPKVGEIRVRVRASGLAYADILCRLGLYPGAPHRPFTPGYDLVGEVDKVGDGVMDLVEGQMVGALLPKFGAQAQHVCAPAIQFVPVPEEVDPVMAVAVILNYLTADRILHNKAKVQRGERMLVHSAAGGVGTALLQLGRLLGLETIGTASAKKLALVTRLGAAAIDYQREDFALGVRQMMAEGVDVVCDPIGSDTMTRSYSLLRRGGRLVNYSFLAAVDEGKTAAVRSLVQIVWYNIRPDGRKAILFGDTPTAARRENEWYRERLKALFRMLSDGRIQPIIGKTLPLSAAAEAQHLLETAAVSGKIVLLHEA
ncbi:MAG: zinc-binding dehydrogenase [Anaerolineaceae bacterium]|nr:zinc-binding dehydrogenase [Anaerolineaceae bacterium]